MDKNYNQIPTVAEVKNLVIKSLRVNTAVNKALLNAVLESEEQNGFKYTLSMVSESTKKRYVAWIEDVRIKNSPIMFEVQGLGAS